MLLRAKSHVKKNEFAQARQLYQSVLDKYPGNKKAMEGLSTLPVARQPRGTGFNQQQADALIGLYRQGRLQEALALGLTLTSQYPDVALIPNVLASVYTGLGRKEEAVASHRKALAIKPDSAETHNYLGVALGNLGKHGEAITSYHRALKLKPDYFDAHQNLGAALSYIGRYKAAIASYQRALMIDPDRAVTHNNLGMVFNSLGRHEEAVASFRRAIELDGNYPSAWGNWLQQLAYLCDWEQLGDKLHQDLTSLEFGTTPDTVLSPFYLLALIDDTGFHHRVSEAYGRVHLRENTALGPLPHHAGAGRIRIGYFSADFHDHATMRLMAGLFEQHDRSRFEVHAFSFGPDRQDTMRTRLLDGVEAFHDVRRHTDAEIAALARSLGIDIAVDLKGYTNYSRPGIFSCRAAPVQVNYLGYPGTLGLPYIDYIIADPVVIPEYLQAFYTEQVVYLPDSYQVNDDRRAIADKPLTRTEAGLPEEGFVYCCFNNNFKIMPAEFDIWMRLLGQVDDSVLWLFASNETAQRNLRNEASKRGIDPQRLVFAGRVPQAEHLARQRLADLFVDTFNYNAHTTASDALWAGLPVLTKLGQGFASRVAGSLLTAVGLPELVTTTAGDYERLALRLALQPDELKAVKDKLAGNLKTAPLFDTERFTRHIEAAYTRMYERMQQGLAPGSFYIKSPAISPS